MRNKKIRTVITTVVLAVGFSACGRSDGAANKTPEMQEEYEEKREELEAENDYQTSVTLSEDEKKADAALTEMKNAYIESCKGDVPYDMPVLKDENIWESELYQFCMDLPKGSDLHIHGLAILPIEDLIDFVVSRPELMIMTEGEGKYKLACHENAEDAEENEMILKAALDEGILDRDEVIRNWSLLGVDEEIDIWEWFERLFDAHTNLGGTNELVEAYYTESFRYCCEHNVMHLESRELLFGSHEDAKARAEAIRSAYYKVRDEYPDFVFSMVGTGLKRTSLYASSDNVIDADLLHAERIGHGLNLYRYPEVLEDVKKSGTCIEVCPISNQILGYVEDLRAHPATEYLKRGLPVALASDDPAYEEHTELVDDFFAAIVCWDLNLDEVKQLCLNSIQYSGLDDVQKKRMQETWEKEWQLFISTF